MGNNVLTPLETTVSMKSKRKIANSKWTQSARSEDETHPPERVRGGNAPGKAQGHVAGPHPVDTGATASASKERNIEETYTSASSSKAGSVDESKTPQATIHVQSPRSEETLPPGRVRGGNEPGTTEPTAAPKAASVRRTRVDRSRFKC